MIGSGVERPSIPGRTFLHYLRYHLGLEGAHTQTTERERTALGEAARDRRAIVELGVFEGVTAKTIRFAMSPDGTLWLVDPFIPGRLGVCWAKSIAKREVSRKTRGRVRFLEQLSWDVASSWTEPLDMVFIDADHSYDAVLRDWTDWSPFVVPGGIVAFHDSSVFPGGWVKPSDGPARVVEGTALATPGFELLDRVDSLTILRRRPS